MKKQRISPSAANQHKKLKPKVETPSRDLFSIIEDQCEKHKIYIIAFILAVCACFAFFLFDVKISTGHDDALYIEGGYNYAKNFFGYYYLANAPLYVMFLALPISIWGINLIILKAFSIVFYVLSLLFLYIAFRRRIPYLVLFGVLLILAINWFCLSYASLTYTEPFFMMVQGIFFIVFFRHIDILENKNYELKQTWKSWLLLGFMLCIMTLTRSIAIATVAVVFVYFLYYKKYLSALYSLLSYAVFYGVFEVIKKLLWGNLANQFSSQGSVMLQKSAYDASQGQETFSGFIDRFLGNTQIYFSARFWEILGFRKEDSMVDGAITVFTILLIVFAIIFILAKKKKFGLGIALYFTTLSAASFIALQTSWGQGRYIMIHVPFILITIFYGFYLLLQTKSIRFFQFSFLILLSIFIVSGFSKTVLKSVKNNNILKKNLKGDIFYGYTPDWVNYLRMSEWCGKNIKDTSSFIACRKAPMSFVYAPKTKFYPIYKVWSSDPDTVLAKFKKEKIRYVILASLRKNPRVNSGEIINTIHRILGPVQEKYPQKLVLIHQEGADEPSYLFEIKN